MGLIKIKKLGYGIEGNRLDLVIAIPKGRFIESFWVANQNDIKEENYTKVGRNYIQGNRDTEEGMTKLKAFRNMFIEMEQDAFLGDDGIEYSVYKLNPTCIFKFSNFSDTGIFISQNNLSFITLQLNFTGGNNKDPYGYPIEDSVETLGDSIINFDPPQHCDISDNSCLIIPLYNINALRIHALSAAKNLECSCEFPNDLVDRILQIKTIEMSLAAKNFYKASFFWNKFFKNKHIATNNKCICHG